MKPCLQSTNFSLVALHVSQCFNHIITHWRRFQCTVDGFSIFSNIPKVKLLYRYDFFQASQILVVCSRILSFNEKADWKKVRDLSMLQSIFPLLLPSTVVEAWKGSQERRQSLSTKGLAPREKENRPLWQHCLKRKNICIRSTHVMHPGVARQSNKIEKIICKAEEIKIKTWISSFQTSWVSKYHRT